MRKLLLAVGSVLLASSLPAAPPDLAELQKMTARFAPTKFVVETSRLSAGDRKALVKLIESARIVNDIFLKQVWEGNPALHAKLKRDHSALGKARLHYFWLNKGPWSEIDDHAAFLPGAPAKKPLGSNFYPEDMTKEEFTAWYGSLAADSKEAAAGFFTRIARNSEKRLTIVPYSEAYRSDLEKAARLLRDAARLTDNASLRTFLEKRAAAFLSNDYFDSDVAWMDLDAPIDVTYGPYETYGDELFGYKAAFEAYICIRDEKESERLKFFSSHLQEIEDHLPENPEYRVKKLGAASPIRVVNEVFAAGDGNHGIQSVAYNLPNDDRVVQQKGSKRIMLKNVNEAKFKTTLTPIAKILLPASAQADIDFEWFFTWILSHELCHGLGPHEITLNGRATNPRLELKDLYASIEEAKADVTGIVALQYLLDQKALPGGEAAEKKLYTTFLASAFRTLHFGLQDAHARGEAVQFNYLTDKGGFVANPDGTFAVDFGKIKGALADLDRELLTIEATGDYARAKNLLDTMAVFRPDVKKAMDRLSSVPNDIEPVFVTAAQIAPETARTAK